MADLNAVQQMIEGPTDRVDRVSKAFFPHLDAMDTTADQTLTAVNHLRNGEAVTDALIAAAASLTTAAHGVLLKDSVKLGNFFGGFAEKFLPATFTTLVPFVSTVLVPAMQTIEQLERFIVRKRYVDHLLALPEYFLAQLLELDNQRGRLQQPSTLVPSASAIAKAEQLLFEELPSLEETLSDLLLPNSTCLAAVSCLADLQIKVHKVRGSARVLRRKIRLLPTLTLSLREPMLATIDMVDAVQKLQPDLELMAVWTTATSGPIPAENTSSSIVQPPVLRQVTGALCSELALRSVQGRPSEASFKLELPCGEMSLAYEDAPSPMATSVEQITESWTLWQKLAATMRFLTGELRVHKTAMHDHLVAAREHQTAYTTTSASFAASFGAMLASFGATSYYKSNMSLVFRMEDAIVTADFDTTASMSIWELRDLTGSAEAALRRASQATSDPFSCRDAPRACNEVPQLALPIAASHDELAYDMSTPELTIPVTLLTGIGDGICNFYGGAVAAHTSLTDMMPPLESLILKYLQGPAALTGNAPSCKPGDRFCLTTALRSDFLYRQVTFGLFFIHFWSLSAPALRNVCGRTLKWRFTIPGLWSASAMQSSTFLAFRSVTKFFVAKCAQVCAPG